VGEEDIHDLRVVPRWLPVGVSGVPRGREWDAVVALELPELAGEPLAELRLTLLADGTLLLDPALPRAAEGARERIAAALQAELGVPCAGVALRRAVDEWALAVRASRADLVDLPALDGVEQLVLAVAPEGGRTLLVDGEEAEPAGALAAAAAELERLGRARFDAFVAQAERTRAGWTVTLDPL
jgi:hypothetical protein